MSARAKFQAIKQEVLTLIQQNEEVTTSTPRGRSGIYLLYVDNFTDNKVLPIYIGKSVDVNSRLRQHINDISELNPIPYCDYHNNFLWGAKQYIGHFKPCKFFKYMIEHQCTLQDIHMIILEYCEKDALESLEQAYLTKYLSAFFGFNQINSITDSWLYKTDPRKYIDIQKRDAELFNKYIEYGFSSFNYLFAFSNSHYNVRYNTHREQLDKFVNKSYYWDSVTRSENISRLTAAFQSYTDVFEQTKLAMCEKFSSPIHEIFEQCKLKSKGREEEVLFLLLNNCTAPETRDVFDKREYLEYYMSRDRKSRECGRRLQELFASHLDEIRRINAPVMEAYQTYVDGRKTLLAHSTLSLIFPTIAYPNYPLTGGVEE